MRTNIGVEFSATQTTRAGFSETIASDHLICLQIFHNIFPMIYWLRVRATLSRRTNFNLNSRWVTNLVNLLCACVLVADGFARLTRSPCKCSSGKAYKCICNTQYSNTVSAYRQINGKRTKAFRVVVSCELLVYKRLLTSLLFNFNNSILVMFLLSLPSVRVNSSIRPFVGSFRFARALASYSHEMREWQEVNRQM